MSVADANGRHEADGVRWIGATDATALRRSAYLRIVDAARRAIEWRGRFLIVLAGGSTPQRVYDLLRAASTDWSCWQVYFGDERCLPPHNTGRNSRMAADILLEHVPIARDQIHVIPAELGAEASAHSYAATLREVGDFDMVLLGLGEDGHTASLFPDHDWGVAPDAPDALAVFDAPKPPPQRVSLSAARLSRAREVLFLVEGVSKRDAVARWRMGASIPAKSIQPPAGVDVLVESRLLREDGA
jgi:6-phosphogluconolactonase